MAYSVPRVHPLYINVQLIAAGGGLQVHVDVESTSSEDSDDDAAIDADDVSITSTSSDDDSNDSGGELRKFIQQLSYSSSW